MDSHSCHPDRVSGSDHEGKIILTEETRPGQISYRCLLPEHLDNLLVTVALSSSHVGWGAVRLEPVWMHVGESAGYALALAKQRSVEPANLPEDALQRTLAERGVMLSFFNDFDLAAPTAEQRAAQYFGTKGFFPSYDARLKEPLTSAVAAIWVRPGADPIATARAVHNAEKAENHPLTAREFARLAGRDWSNAPAGPLTRGAACAWLFAQR